MSEIENIARNIVRQEEERQVEKIKLESEIKALEEVLEHGISTEFVEDEVIYIYSPKTAHDMREKLYENYKQLHAQITIPKSIAEQADKIAFYDLQKEGVEEFHQWFDYKQDEYMDVVFAYLNPLTRDLVKVVEG